jgi:hypothetical protein
VAMFRRFGLRRHDDESHVRNAALGATGKGRDFLDATERLQTITVTANQRRLGGRGLGRTDLRDLAAVVATGPVLANAYSVRYRQDAVRSELTLVSLGYRVITDVTGECANSRPHWRRGENTSWTCRRIRVGAADSKAGDDACSEKGVSSGHVSSTA